MKNETNQGNSSCTEQPYMNHSSTPSLYPLEKVGKTASVTSLSVGVQYDPRDTVEHHHHHRGHRYSAVEYIPANGLRRHHSNASSQSGNTQKSHFHLSAPDFRPASAFQPQPELRRHSSRHRHHDLLHHHHHHLHHKGIL